MCNAYSITTNVEAIRALVKVFNIDERMLGTFPLIAASIRISAGP